MQLPPQGPSVHRGWGVSGGGQAGVGAPLQRVGNWEPSPWGTARTMNQVGGLWGLAAVTFALLAGLPFPR